MHHVFKNNPVQKRLISVRKLVEPPKIITREQFTQSTDSCTNYRDKFLLWLLYETGLRIGQALALRHEDIVCWDNEIRIKYRCNNLNEVRNKSYKPNTLQVSNTVMDLYSKYISSLDQNKLTDYVFINFNTYTPLRYSAVKKQIFANCVMAYLVISGHHSFLEVTEIWNRQLDFVAIEYPELLSTGIIPSEPTDIRYIEASDAPEKKLPYAIVGNYSHFLHSRYRDTVIARMESQLADEGLDLRFERREPVPL